MAAPGNQYRAFPVALVVKNPPANAGGIRDASLIPGSGRSPGGGQGNPLQYSFLVNPMDRSLVDSPWGCKESDTTEATQHAHTLTFSVHFHCRALAGVTLFSGFSAPQVSKLC